MLIPKMNGAAMLGQRKVERRIRILLATPSQHVAFAHRVRLPSGSKCPLFCLDGCA